MNSYHLRKGRCGYGYFAGYPYSELLEKFRDLLDHGIEPDPIWSFNLGQEREYVLFRFSKESSNSEEKIHVLYSRNQNP